MKDEVLERVWKARKTISEQCGFDSRQLVKFYQQRAKKKRIKPSRAINPDSTAAPS